MSDLISREALKKALHNFFDGKVIDEPAYILRDVFYHIDNAPTVETIDSIDGYKNQIDDLAENLAWYVNERNRLLKERRPKGKWIVTAEDNHGVHRICCPFCHFENGSENSSIIITTFTKFPNFCEKCGADMRGAE